MAVSNEYIEHIREKLAPIENLIYKRMFGGVGIFYESKMFGMISSDERLLFKVNDSNIQDYTDYGSNQLEMHKKGKGMPYYYVPIEIYEDDETLIEWARQSIEIALAK